MQCRKAVWALALAAAVLLPAPASLWAQSTYLDEFIVRVKPDKVSDFEAISKKVADANRHANGDHWLAEVSVYGESNTYIFTSRRDNYADIDKANDMFMAAMTKSLGKAAADKLLQDVNNCVISSRTELRIRRPDLSSKMPTDAQALNKFVGESRVLRTLTLRVRPGHEMEFEAMLKDINSHADSNPNTQPVLVSEAVEGDRGATYYVTFLRSSLGAFDHEVELKDIMGEEGMAKMMKTIGEVSAGSESAIYRFSPELSNPPDEIAQVAPDFWNPKAMTASMQKPKAKPAGAAESANAKPKEK